MDKKSKKEQQQLLKPKVNKEKYQKMNVQQIEGLAGSGNVFNQLSKAFVQEIEEKKKEQEEPELLNNFDQNVLKILSMINKKSEITKQKGLYDLKQLIEEKDQKFIEKFLPNFVFLYKQFTQMEQPNSKNLIIINQILKSIMVKGKKYLNIYIKNLFFYWWMNMNDSNMEIKLAANKAFEAVFKDEQQEQIIVLCQKEYIESLREYFDSKNQNENKDIQERMLFGILTGLAKIMKIVSQENKSSFSQQISEEVIGELNTQDNLGLILTQKKGTKVISAFIDLLQDLFNDDQIQLNIYFLTNIVNDNIMIENDYIQKSLWNTGIQFILRNIKKLDLKLDLSNKIIENIKNLGFQIGAPFFENLVVVISLIKVNQNFQKFIQQMFEYLRQILLIKRKGLQKDEYRFFGDNIVTSYFECCQFLIQKRQDQIKIVLTQIQNLNQDFIDLNNQNKINQIQFRSIPQKFAKFVINIQQELETIKMVFDNLQQIKVSNKFNFNQILIQLGKVQLNNECLQIYITILKNENEQQIEQIINILNSKIQNNDKIQELSERVQQYYLFIIAAKNFISENEDFYMNTIKLFFQNIYHYNEIKYIENFIQAFSKIANKQVKDYIFEKYQINKNEKNIILLSYVIDNNLNDNIFSKYPKYQFQELELSMKQLRNKYQDTIENYQLDYIYIFFQDSFKLKNQQHLLILYHLIKYVKNLNLDKIIQSFENNIQYEGLYSLLFILAKTQNLQFYQKFSQYCYEIKDLKQIDQLFCLIQKKELIEIAIIGFKQQLQYVLDNLSKIDIITFSHISKQFINRLQKLDQQEQISQIFRDYIFNKNFNIEEIKIWEYLEEIIDLDKISLLLPEFQQQNFKTYSILLCLNRDSNISKKSKLQHFYSELQEELVKIIIHQEEFENYYDYLFDLCKNENLIYLNVLKILAQQTTIRILQKKMQQYNDEITFLICYQILPIVCDSYDQIQTNCNFLSQLGLKLSVKKIQINEDEYENINMNLFQNLNNSDFNILIFFKYLNFMIEKGNIVYFGEHIQKIEQIFFDFIEKKQCDNTILILLEIFAFIRKISNLLELFTNKFQIFIKRDFYIYCSNKLKDEQLFLQGDYFVIDMAETINRLMNQIDQNFPVNNVFMIMNSDYQSLQKSAFLSLYYYFNNVKIDNFEQIASPDIEDEEVEKLITQYYYSNLIDNLQIESKYKYLLNWILLIQNASQNHNKCQDYFIISRMAKILVDKYYTQFLNFIFEEKLQNQQNLLNLEDCLIQDNQVQLQMNALLIFTQNYPVNIRNYFEVCEKRYIKQAEYVLKNIIGPELFQSEIELIELRQHEWKSEEFDIFVSQNTREINAIYIKENQELQISLKIPQDYPRKQIKIEVNKGVKIEKSKIKKWILRMKALLINQNNSIINSLMLWKQNIDKEFLNIEECPICYFIIHSGTRQLPKLACKTCKHKFHSACIHKWFQSSNKSECPLCKSQFL